LYARAIIEIALPDESVVTTSPGERPPAELADLLPLVVITAWNPGSERPGLAVNQAAHEELLARVRTLSSANLRPLTVLKAGGRSADGTHLEDSVAVHGLDLSDALELGRRMRQAAIFELTASEVRVVDCRAAPR
jgi:hypothetical protein